MRHYHVWIHKLDNHALMMLAMTLPKTEIKRQRERGTRRLVRRWWKTRSSARQALESAKAAGRCKGGFIHECELEHECPEWEHVISN